MGREISSPKRLQVVKLYFEGLAYEDISQRTGVSKGSVAAIVEELRQGRFPELQDSVDLLTEMRELATGLRKVGTGPAQAAALFIVAKRFMALGVEPASLEAWVEMCQRVPEEEFPRSGIIQAATKLVKLEEEGVSYEEAIARLSASSAELKELGERIDALRKEQSKLEEKKTTLASHCRALGQDKERLEVERRKTGESIQNLLARSQRLGKQVAEREAALSQLEGRHHDLSATLPRLEEEVAERTGTLTAIEGLGFSRDQLEKLRGSLCDMAQKHGREELATKFFECLRTYEAFLGLEARRAALAAEVDRLQRQRESLATLGERVGLPPEEVAEGIAAMKALVRKGVSPASVVSYQRLLSSMGMEHQSFERTLHELGGVAAVLSRRRNELEQIEQELAAKGQALQGLKAEEGRLKESIATLRDSAVKQIQEMAGSAVADVQKLSQGLQEDIIRWGQVRAEMGKCEEELRLARYFTTIPLTEGALASLVEEITAALVIQYFTVGLAWCCKNMNVKLRPPRPIIKKYYTISEYTEVELADLITWALLLLTEGMGSADR